jgi:putative ABC transport system permease protein
MSLGVGYLLATGQSSLPLILSPLGLGLWLLIIVIGSIAASAFPARKASSLTIRETLSYV